MEEKKRFSKWNIVAGIFTIVCTLPTVFVMFVIVFFGGGDSFFSNSELIEFNFTITPAVFLSVVLFMRKRNILLLIPFGIWAAVVLYYIISELTKHFYSVPFIFSLILEALAYAGVIVIGIFTLMLRNPKAEMVMKKIWYIPASLFSLYSFLSVMTEQFVMDLWRDIFCFVFGTSWILFVCLWLVFPYAQEKGERVEPPSVYGNYGISTAGEPAAEYDKESYEAIPETTYEDKTIEQLKAYKELLDSGIITQEEFDAKKKQLLGL